jgi:O-antigen/teichoic acid export membrane protein
MYTARYLGAEGFGILSFSIAFTSIFGVFGDLGLSPLTVREVARSKLLSDKYLGNIAIIKIVLAITTIGLISITINFLGYSHEIVKVVYLIAFYVILTTFSNMFYAIFQAYEKMEYQSIGQIISSALLLFGVFWAIHYGYNVIGFAGIYLIAGMITLVYNLLIYYWKFSLSKLTIDWHFWKPTIKAALPFFFSAIVDIIAFKIDIVMLSMMKGDVVVGWYSAAYRLIEVLIFIPATIASVVYPVLSNFYISEQQSLKLIYEKLFKYLVISGIPIAVGTTILAHKIILLIYKSDFSNSVIALQILIWTIPIIFLNYVFGTILASINQQVLALKINFLSMVLNVTINMLLIPRYSFIGASIATVITCLMAVILFFSFLSRNITRISIQKYIYKPVLASIVMGLFIFFLIDINLLLLIILSIIVYFVALLFLKTSLIEDLSLLETLSK